MFRIFDDINFELLLIKIGLEMAILAEIVFFMILICLLVYGTFGHKPWKDFYRILHLLSDVKFYEEPGFFLEKFLACRWPEERLLW